MLVWVHFRRSSEVVTLTNGVCDPRLLRYARRAPHLPPPPRPFDVRVIGVPLAAQSPLPLAALAGPRIHRACVAPRQTSHHCARPELHADDAQLRRDLAVRMALHDDYRSQPRCTYEPTSHLRATGRPPEHNGTGQADGRRLPLCVVPEAHEQTAGPGNLQPIRGHQRALVHAGESHEQPQHRNHSLASCRRRPTAPSASAARTPSPSRSRAGGRSPR